jgi:hypothetical protein
VSEFAGGDAFVFEVSSHFSLYRLHLPTWSSEGSGHKDLVSGIRVSGYESSGFEKLHVKGLVVLMKEMMLVKMAVMMDLQKVSVCFFAIGHYMSPCSI